MLPDAQGFVKLYRRLLDKPIWLQSTPQQKAVLVAILLMANFKEQEWYWQGEKYICRPGQFVSSLEGIAKRCGRGISARNVRTALEKFQTLGFLTSEASNQGRLISIVNWSLFQQDEKITVKRTVRYQSNDCQAPVKDQSPNKKERMQEGKNVRTINPYEDIIHEFNTTCLALPTVQTLTKARRKLIAARWQQMNEDMNAVQQFFRRVDHSDFLCGRINSFTASFDWIMAEKNYVKIIEGNYDNKEGPDSPAVASLKRFLARSDGNDQADGGQAGVCRRSQLSRPAEQSP